MKCFLLIAALLSTACTTQPYREKKRAPTQTEFEHIMEHVRSRQER